MPFLAGIYTHEQREALATTYLDRGIRPASRVVELAAAGELAKGLAPFATTEGTVRDAASKLRKRRAGQLASDLAKEPPRDAVEALRQRLVSLADRELAALERKKAGTVPLEHLRQVVRVVREVAALPGPDDPRPVQPGAKRPGTQTTEGGKTTGGLAGALLNASEPRVSTRETQPAPTATGQDNQDGDTAPSSAARDAPHNAAHTEPSTAPGEWAREQVGGSLAGA